MRGLRGFSVNLRSTGEQNVSSDASSSAKVRWASNRIGMGSAPIIVVLECPLIVYTDLDTSLCKILRIGSWSLI
jgi:hypothetical protein